MNEKDRFKNLEIKLNKKKMKELLKLQEMRNRQLDKLHLLKIEKQLLVLLKLLLNKQLPMPWKSKELLMKRKKGVLPKRLIESKSKKKKEKLDS